MIKTQSSRSALSANAASAIQFAIKSQDLSVLVSIPILCPKKYSYFLFFPVRKSITSVPVQQQCKPKPKSKNSSKVKNRTRVRKVSQVKIENRDFTSKQQYFQLILYQSLSYVMLHVHSTTRRIRSSNHRTIHSSNTQNIESDYKSFKIEHFIFISFSSVDFRISQCVYRF